MTASVVPIDDGLAAAVNLARAGDETAFARIINAHHDDMIRVCFVICGDLDVADEAVQAAWPIVCRGRQQISSLSKCRPLPGEVLIRVGRRTFVSEPRSA
jgi:DNA-directed RNA polymerase specialized sigma24 family protein